MTPKKTTCPNCGKELSKLHYHAHVTGIETGSFDGDFDQESLEVDFDSIEFRCPECESVLYTNTCEAESFLTK